MARNRILAVIAALAVVAGAFGAGYLTGHSSDLRPQIVFADRADIGDHMGSFFVGDTAYGLHDSVAWTDASGTHHTDGWPDCLPSLHSYAHVRFAGAVVWFENAGQAMVLWVDCRQLPTETA